MTITIANLLLNFLIVGLLMATIGYCWVLNKRIKILQDGKSELANLLKYFDESTARASESIVALQSASKKIGENIQARIDKVNYLMDDLVFLIEKGERLVSQLDANFAANRVRNRNFSENNNELDISEDISTMEVTAHKLSPTVEFSPTSRITEKLSTKEKAAASLEMVLDRVIGRSKSFDSNSDASTNEKNNVLRSKVAGNARSKAEKELLDMIRAGIKG